MTWSPQRYIEEGLGKGRSQNTLDASIAAIEEFINLNPNLPVLLTIGHLAERAGVEFPILRAIADRSRNGYKTFYIRKRSGGLRRISVPEPPLMVVQRWIASYILNLQPVHSCSFAFRPKASILKCAARHTGASWLVKMDVQGFFESISEIQVYRVFLALGYRPLVAFELARLCTCTPAQSPRYNLEQWRVHRRRDVIEAYQSNRIGFLPQGAPTSPMLSNLVMMDADKKIEEVAKKDSLTYTRYSDDLTFSTRGEFDRSRAKVLIREVSKILGHIGMWPNPNKTVVVPPGGRKIVLGLLVDSSMPKLTRDFRSRLRQHIYYLEKLGPIEHARSRNFDSVWGLHQHVRGLIDFAIMIDPKFAAPILKRFEAVGWLSGEEVFAL